MADPQTLLDPVVRAALARALGDEHGQADPMLRASQHADIQANVALGLAKKLGRPPRDIAQAIKAELAGDAAFSKVEVAGPGFVNLWLDDAFLSRELAKAAKENLGIERPAHPDTVVIDYSSPNAAKEMHVGHLRSSIIGDALARVLEALGHRVIRQNHLGDWGTPFGMLIEHWLDGGAEAQEQSARDPNAFYQAARQKFDSDPAFAERARKRVVALQSGDATTLARWQELIDSTKRYLGSIYQLLGVSLGDADIAGESLYNAMLPTVVEELEKKGLAVRDQGAVCIFPPGFSGREGEPLPLIIEKQDGGYGYATTDLAAVRYRVEKLGATRIVYVVGAPQAQHLAMLFASARLAGWLPESVRAEHVSFGSVLGSDRKMFRTREGETVRLIDLLNEAVRRADAVVREKNPSLEPAEREKIARAVGIGAVKYADLSSDRVKDYVFDWDRMLSFEGNTAPYIQYAHARIRSIFRKGETDAPPAERIRVEAPEEHALGLALLGFPRALDDVAETLCPHKLTGYLWDLSTAFSAFFEGCPVLKAPTAETRASRLALADLTARTIARGLDVLGIEAPDRM